MPIRKTPLVTDEIYHVYNRSIVQQPIFDNKKECNRILNLIDFYRFKDNPLRFSHFDRLEQEEKKEYLNLLHKSPEQIKILSFSIMPNHYHFLLKQSWDLGITNFIRFIQDSYAKYFNLKTKRNGSLFVGPFKAVRVESEGQFLHLSRYIHLNQLTSYVLKEPEELKSCKLNSYLDYISNKPRPFVETSVVMSFFKNKKDFEGFVLNQLDYQRNLEKIKHLLIED
ncbi:transposase [Patescibacteria group bacterium]|nr:transposase [Patescibacteria group bacterium]